MSLVFKLAGCFCAQQFTFQCLDLTLNGCELRFLAPEKGEGDAGFFLQPGRGEDVGVLALVRVLAEVAELDQPLFDQRAQAVVGLAEADAQLGRELALAEAGVGLQELEDLQAPGFGRGAGVGVHFCGADCTLGS